MSQNYTYWDVYGYPVIPPRLYALADPSRPSPKQVPTPKTASNPKPEHHDEEEVIDDGDK